MLDRLRAGKRGILAWVVIGGLIAAFVLFFGPGSFGKGQGGLGSPPTYAAKVNGETISLPDYERAYTWMLRNWERQLGPQFSREMAEQLGLPQQALRAVVDSTLLTQEAARRGIIVTDDEIDQLVKSDPRFRDANGRFDFDAYDRYTREESGSPRHFEDVLRAQLLREKLLGALSETVKVSPVEVRERWEALANRADVSFVLFPVAAARAAVKVSDDDVKAFAAKEGARIDAFYKAHPERFDQKAKVQLRHVLALVAPGKDDAAAKKKIEDARARVQKGEAFEKVAAEVSEDPNTKDKGGELGSVSEGLVDPAVMKAALALQPGQVSEPVRSATGWHLLKVEAVTPAKQVPLDQARPEIARELLTDDRAIALSQEKARDALAALKGGKTLAALFPSDDKKGQKLGSQLLVPQDTGPFALAQATVPHLGVVPELSKDVLAANAGDVLPKVYDTAGGAIVAVVKTRERPDQAKFADQKGEIERRLRSEKLMALQQAWTDELRAKASIDENEALLARGPATRPAAEE